jgi:Holliday junction resolvasome RuvABC endonuclease subunit
VKTILALDLATLTGWAYRDRAGIVTAGSWLLQDRKVTSAAAKERMDRKLDARVPALYRKVVGVWNEHRGGPGPNNPIDFVVFEDVQFGGYTQQNQLWSSLRTAVWLFCYNYGIPIDCCPVTTLKHFATGSGAADKTFMMAEAAKAFPDVAIVDDNAADALHLLRWAIVTHERQKTS